MPDVYIKNYLFFSQSCSIEANILSGKHQHTVPSLIAVYFGLKENIKLEGCNLTVEARTSRIDSKNPRKTDSRMILRMEVFFL